MINEGDKLVVKQSLRAKGLGSVHVLKKGDVVRIFRKSSYSYGYSAECVINNYYLVCDRLSLEQNRKLRRHSINDRIVKEYFIFFSKKEPTQYELPL